MSSPRTFPGSCAAQQDLKWSFCKGASRGIITEIRFYDMMFQTRCHTASAVFCLALLCVVHRPFQMCVCVCVWLCSAGCGRTGAICAIDYTWNLLKAGVCDEEQALKNVPVPKTATVVGNNLVCCAVCFQRKSPKILMFFGWSKKWGPSDTLRFRQRFVFSLC